MVPRALKSPTQPAFILPTFDSKITANEKRTALKSLKFFSQSW